MEITSNLRKLLEFSKHKKLNNVKKPNNCQYNGYLDLLEYTSFLSENSTIKERLYYVEHKLFEPVQCDTCDNATYWNVRTKIYQKYCSICSKRSPEYRTNYKNAMMEKYGVEHNWSTGELRDKDLKNQVLKHGTDEEIKNIESITSNQQLSKIKTKSKSSMMEKYGVEHNWLSGELRDKDLKNQVLKYGTDEEIKNIDNIKSMFQLESSKRKSISTNLARYGKEYYNNSHLIRRTVLTKFYNNLVIKLNPDFEILTQIADYIINTSSHIKYKHKCGTVRTSHIQHIRCLKCYPYNKSMGEHEVLEFCKSLTSEVQSNLRSIIPPLELDIYIPYRNLAIEYDGVFWHSSDSVETESKDYHLYKTDQCVSKGIQLFHIFENEWQDPQKQEIWKSIIRNKLGKSQRIFARKTIVTRITSKETKEFLDSNHLQGACVSSMNLGLVFDDELVAIMTFGRSRYDKGVDWELLRYCGKLGTSIVGGASKLLAQFRRDNEGSIVSYADKRRSNGNLYEKLGFELSHESAPNYWYYKDPMVLESRLRYQKHKLRDRLELFDDKLTESENMYMNGYRKIYDCGNQVWKLK